MDFKHLCVILLDKSSLGIWKGYYSMGSHQGAESLSKQAINMLLPSKLGVIIN